MHDDNRGPVTTSIKDLFINLDRAGPIPLYYQIAQRLQDAIESGQLPAGSRIENEVELADQLNISRPTVRRAIRELADKGMLVRRRGVGTQVVPGRLKRGVEFTSLYDALSLSGRSPTTRVLTREAVVPPAEVLEALALPPGTEVLHTVRLRYSEDVPFALLENYMPPAFLDLAVADLEKYGLYQLLRGRGVAMRVARQTIGARVATKQEADLFEQDPGSPVLTMTRTFFDQSGQAFEYGLNSYRPDMYAFEMTVVEK
ncbi:GntR family transcriptional regulator [Devosia sp. PTR5]|uniref:GntR family transcriptional regulator n=1 Tax=Devosia oryzisoli TaxID=2774138 RepID=A0A927FXA6_9HYPH|nr:GntR family transcriptional regulator [Devosia oryzisoli]MBD8066608.1 GntR family transcriptional regulator [Devosia oryzisoli]